jgi:predicted PurR-regulated permease PerM
MQMDENTIRKIISRDLMDLLIRVGLIILVIVVSVRVLAPFASLLVWALILAVALYPLHARLSRRLNDRQILSAILLVLAGLLLIGIPTLMFGISVAQEVRDTYTAYENNKLTIGQPDASVAQWPVIGESVYSSWKSAADNLPNFLKNLPPQFDKMAKGLLSIVAGTAGAVILFIGSLIVAGIMLAYSDAGSRAIKLIFTRVTGPSKGSQLQQLSASTIRSVANGVIGVAFIQAVLVGIGFAFAGIPAAGLLALVALLLGVAQLPLLVITLPAIAYIWWGGDTSTAYSVFLTIYLLVAGMVDNVLKPMLLGRGVAVPMPVILIGALGGMVSGGIVGMFIGAVVLAVGYEIFMDWLNNSDSGESQSA